MFVPSRTNGIFLGGSCLTLLKTETFALTKTILIFYQSMIKYHFFLQNINIQIYQVVLFVKNFWISRSFRESQIATDCSVLTDSVFFALCAYFDGSMVFFDEFFPKKSWNTVDIMQKQNMNWFGTVLIVVICFLTLTDLTKVLLSFVWLKFSSFGLSYDGWRKDRRA